MPRNIPTARILLMVGGIALGILPVLLGCQDGVWDWSAFFQGKPDSKIDTRQPLDPLADSAAYRDTVAQYAYFDGLRRLRVRGYGLVAGLGGNGSSQCPNAIAQQLKQEMYKTRRFAQRRGQHVSPAGLIEDMDTAVVAVEGEIPAAALAGERFDLIVRAIPGTETVSLEGGTLYECNLQIFRPVGATGWIPGKAVAVGAGPVFLNPFGRSDDAATKPNLRQAVVIGGGLSQEDRRIRLLLTNPSYQMAIQIADSVNDRFGSGGDKVADAVSPAEIKIKIPPAYSHDPKHYVALVQHLYPTMRPEFMVERTRELAREFDTPDAPHAEIALAWEAIGKNALPQVQKFYAHPRPACSFHAAAIGVLLGDEPAVEILESHLQKPTSPHRLAAIRVLGAVPDLLHAARPLRRALNDPDPRIRTAAYEALLQRNDPNIVSIEIGTDAFAIDLVPSEADHLIYVKRSGQRRIALFGRPILARPPLFYSSPGETLIIDASPHATHLTVVRKSPVRGIASPPIRIGLDIAHLVALLGENPPQTANAPIRGLGVSYGGITRVLSELCESRAINAKFMLETPRDPFMLRPHAPPGRRESDL